MTSNHFLGGGVDGAGFGAGTKGRREDCSEPRTCSPGMAGETPLMMFGELGVDFLELLI